MAKGIFVIIIGFLFFSVPIIERILLYFGFEHQVALNTATAMGATLTVAFILVIEIARRKRLSREKEI